MKKGGKNPTHQSLWMAVKVVPREKYIALNAYIQKEKSI